MKTWIITLLTVLATCGIVSAQDYPKHELSLSYGIFTDNEIAETVGGVLGTVFTAGAVQMNNYSFSGAVSVEYAYHVSKVLAFGGAFCYERATMDIVMANAKVGVTYDNYYTVMPIGKANWANWESVRLYSKLGLGVTVDAYRQSSAGERHYNHDVNFAFQFSPIGIEIGRRVNFFAEGGFGVQGIVQAGMRVRF